MPLQKWMHWRKSLERFRGRALLACVGACFYHAASSVGAVACPALLGCSLLGCSYVCSGQPSGWSPPTESPGGRSFSLPRASKGSHMNYLPHSSPLCHPACPSISGSAAARFFPPRRCLTRRAARRAVCVPRASPAPRDRGLIYTQPRQSWT